MTDKVSQKQAVIDATKRVMGSTYDSATAVTDVLTKDEVNEIKKLVFDGIATGNVIYNKEFSEVETKKYVSGMVSNHFRKAKELNGGSSYKPTISRKVKSDDTLTTLNIMLNKCVDGTDEHAKVVEAINTRKGEIAAAKNKNTYDIDVTVLPDDLKAVISSEM